MFNCPCFLLGVVVLGHLHVVLDDDVDRRLRLVSASLFGGRRRSLGRVLDWALNDWLTIYEAKLGLDVIPQPPQLDLPPAILKPPSKPVNVVKPNQREQTVRDTLRRLGLSQPT
jgi:hypothetical protein